MNVRPDSLRLGFHHAHEFDARIVEFLFRALLEKREDLLARKLGINGKAAIRKIDHRVHASATVHRTLHLEHVRGKEVGQQALEARFTELPAKVRQLQKIIQIVNRIANRSNLTQLLFGSPKMLLHFFKLRKSFLDVLIELGLHLLGDGHQLCIHALANRFEALGSLLIQSVELGF